MKRVQSASWLLIALALCAWVGLQWFTTLGHKRLSRYTLHFSDGLTYKLDATTGHTEVIVSLPTGPVFFPIWETVTVGKNPETAALALNYLATQFSQRNLAWRLQTVANLSKKGWPLETLLDSFKGYTEGLKITYEPSPASDQLDASIMRDQPNPFADLTPAPSPNGQDSPTTESPPTSE